MSLLSEIAAYASVVAAVGSIGTAPVAPTLPPPTVMTIQSDDNYQVENRGVDALSVGSHMVNNIGDIRGNNANKTIINGIDVSAHQHKGTSSMDTQKVIDSGEIKFAFIKATEGTHYINPHFRDDTVTFINNNTPVGFYHYARPTNSTDDAKEQARYFVKVTGIDQGVKSFPPVLDIEEDEGLNSTEIINWVDAFVNEVKDLTGKDTMIYTYPNFWRDKMNNTTKFNHLPLWIADYNKQAQPLTPLPGGWSKWTFWQYTSEEKITGIDDNVDGNVFNGNHDELLSLYR